ncbi:ComF family protein [Oxalobacteraceae bacterium CAVE-383]|nr:ComF family protein [Oxalobacteraceae bacterium CAVE-383]
MFPTMLRLAAQLRYLIPSSCALCGLHARETLCEGCRRQFFTPAGAGLRCPVCAIPLPASQPRCGDCLRAPPAFDATVTAADYIAPLDQLVLALKFGGKLALAPLFARLLADALLNDRRQYSRIGAPLPALLTGVPLSPGRLRIRGFNQSLEMARPLARLTGMALAPQLLLRIRDTHPQSQLAPPQRRSNIAGAFDLAPPHARRIAGLHIGVVDDVMTTGQTLNEIAAVLKRHGAARVTNLVFARTLR